MKVSKHDGSLLIYCNRIYDRKEELSYEKRHVYNLAILLAAGTIMMSACGKKPAAPADTTAPHRLKALPNLPQKKQLLKLHLKPRFQKVQKVPNFMLQGTITKAEKDGSAFTLLADDGNEYTMLFLISAMWKQRLKRISRLPLPV